MGSFFFPPKMPSPPPPPPPPEPPKPPREVDKSAEEMEARKASLARKRSGRRSTIMTGPLCDTSDAGSYKKTLLGD